MYGLAHLMKARHLKILIFLALTLLPPLYVTEVNSALEHEMWADGQFFTLAEINGSITFIDPYGNPFYMQGIAYSPVEIWSGEIYAMRDTLKKLKADIELIKSIGFNSIKLWGVEWLLKEGLLDDFLAYCEEKEIAVFIPTMPPYDSARYIDPSPDKWQTYLKLLRTLAETAKTYKSVIFYAIWQPLFCDVIDENEFKELMETAVATVKEVDPNHMVSVFSDYPPDWAMLPKTWSENVTLVGVQPYSLIRDEIDKDRIISYIQYYEGGPPVYIDEWGFRTYAQPNGGTHSLTERKCENIVEFIYVTRTLPILGWSYFMLRDKWEGDWGIIGFESTRALRGAAATFQFILENPNISMELALAKASLYEAEDSISIAEEEGRYIGLCKARNAFIEASNAFEEGNYHDATILARKAKYEADASLNVDMRRVMAELNLWRGSVVLSLIAGILLGWLVPLKWKQWKLSWKISTQPENDLWKIPLECTVKKDLADEFFGKLKEHLEKEAPSRYKILLSNICLEEKRMKNLSIKDLRMSIHLPPWDAKVIQDLKIRGILEKGKDAWDLSIQAHRKEGELRAWIFGNKRFVAELREWIMEWIRLHHSS